jgi:hypothetical protein
MNDVIIYTLIVGISDFADNSVKYTGIFKWFKLK